MCHRSSAVLPAAMAAPAIVLALALALCGLIAAGPAIGPIGAAAAASGGDAAARRLIEQYSPIAMVREQQDPPCDTVAEQYQPTSVGTVLGNREVELTRYAGDRRIALRRAPTAADIAGLGEDHYLDLRGDPLGDTCVYARDFERLKRRGRAPVVVYAHIARERGQRGFALQYWFYWYFNQFNDLHESDWEGMQIWFDEPDPQRALERGPDQMILFQHAGGERAEWDDSKVEKQGTHPIVYPAAGSHATFYNSAVYVENGEHGSGVGCDNSSEPLRRLRPRPITLPDHVTDRGRFAWLSYYGRWGQREKGFNNGPTGPQTKDQWRQPYTWMSQQRRSSPRMPGGSIIGPQVTGAFCGAVETASGLLNSHQREPVSTYALIAAGLIALIAFGGVTRWGPIDIEVLRARRSFGQLIRGARRLYGRHWLPMLAIAAVAIPIIGLAQLAGDVLGGSSSIGSGADTTGFSLAFSDFFNTVGRPIAGAIVAAVVIVFVRQLAADPRQAGFRPAWRGMLQRFWRVVLAQLLATLGVALMFISVIGIPFAIWKLVGWGFVQQEVIFTDKSLRRAFRGSSEIVRGRWWHAVRAIVFFNLIGAVLGPVLGFVLIFTSLPLGLINLIGSLVYALLIPYVALGTTLLYFDLQVRAETEPAKPPRSWRPWRPRRFGRRRAAPAGAG